MRTRGTISRHVSVGAATGPSFGPAKLPADVTQRLNQAFVEAMASPELRARMSSLMAEGSAGTPKQFAAFVKAELAKYEQVVKASGASTD